MRAIPVALLTAALALAGAAGAGEVTVGSGASVDLGTGSLDLGEGDLNVEGTFSAGSVGVENARHVAIGSGGVLNGDSATITLCGNWSNAGTFNPGSSTVQFTDGACGLSLATLSGNTSFANLAFSSASGKEFQLASGSTQTVTGALSLLGVDGDPLVLRSTSAGSEAFLDVQGSGSGDYVDVDDVDASAGNAIALGSNSSAGSNAPGWEVTLSEAVPAVTMLGMLVLTLGFAWMGWRELRAAA